jgi:hypothetical protein
MVQHRAFGLRFFESFCGAHKKLDFGRPETGVR